VGGVKLRPAEFLHLGIALHARWLLALLRESPELLPLERRVTSRPEADWPDAPSEVLYDASPWGGGAILREKGTGKILDLLCVRWAKQTSSGRLQIAPGLPKFQTFWEYLTLLLALEAWGGKFPQHSLTLLGDNLASLQLSLTLSGRKELTAIGRELAVRKVRRNWRWKVAHIPAEHNGIADALSRRYAPGPVEMPLELQGRLCIDVRPEDVWTVL